eukprot:2050392-Rhodomonas_salina.1
MERAKSSSRHGFVRITPGITLLHAVNSESSSVPRFPPTALPASTYSTGTKLSPCRTAEFTLLMQACVVSGAAKDVEARRWYGGEGRMGWG